MSAWEGTPALSRALLVGALLVGGALLFGEPVLVVLAGPLVVVAAFGLVHRPDERPGRPGPSRPRLALRGPGHPLTTGRDRGRRRRARDPRQRAGAVRRPAPGVGPRRRVGARRRPGAGDQPATVGTAHARRGAGRADQPLGGVPLGTRARARRGDERAAGVGAVRQRGRRAAAARSGRVQPVATHGWRGGVRGHPPVPRRRPAAPDQLAGLLADRRAPRRSPRRPRRTAGCCSSSTRWPTSAVRAGSAARPAAST